MKREEDDVSDSTNVRIDKDPTQSKKNTIFSLNQSSEEKIDIFKNDITRGINQTIDKICQNKESSSIEINIFNKKEDEANLPNKLENIIIKNENEGLTDTQNIQKNSNLASVEKNVIFLNQNKSRNFKKNKSLDLNYRRIYPLPNVSVKDKKSKVTVSSNNSDEPKVQKLTIKRDLAEENTIKNNSLEIINEPNLNVEKKSIIQRIGFKNLGLSKKSPNFEKNNHKSDSEKSLTDNDEDSSPKCKICFSFNNPVSNLPDLITPCGCKGSIKYVHSTCLKLWRFQGKNIREIKKCEQCCCEYTIGGEFLPNRYIVRSTNIILISIFFLISNMVIRNLQEAVFFLLDEDVNDEWIAVKTYMSKKQLELCESMNKAKKEIKKTVLRSEIKDKEDDRNIYFSNGVDYSNNQKSSSSKKFLQSHDDPYEINNKNGYFADGKTYKQNNFSTKYFSIDTSKNNDFEFYDMKQISLYTSTIIVLLLYSFTFSWKFWPVFNFYFTAWRYYQLGFFIDKYLLFAFAVYYTTRMYLDFYTHIDTLYIFVLNYRA